MNQFFRKLHLWVSIPFGIVITITCFTGAILVFESDITEWCNRGMTTVEPKEKPLPVKQLMSKVESQLDDGVTITGVTIPDDPSQAYKVNLSKPHRAAVYIDQYTGNVKGKYERPAFFDTVRKLHRWLMIPSPKGSGTHWGKMIVGASTLAFLVILITGIVIWWPRNRKMLRNRLQINTQKGKRRFWHDLHVAGGIYAVIFLIAMAATGLTWSYEWYRNGVYSMLGAETTQTGGNSTRKSDATTQATVQADAATQATMQADATTQATVQADATTQATVQADATTQATVQADATTQVTVQADATTQATVQADATTQATLQADAATQATAIATDAYYEVDNWQKALEAATARSSDYRTMTISAGTITVEKSGLGNQGANDKFTFNEKNGEITSYEPYSKSSRRSKVSGWIRTIHVGTWGGWITKILYFLAALLGATLPVTGYYLWFKRLYGKKEKL